MLTVYDLPDEGNEHLAKAAGAQRFWRECRIDRRHQPYDRRARSRHRSDGRADVGPSGRGELAAIQTWPSLSGYWHLGTDQALVYYAARDPDRVGRYVGSAAVIALVSCLPFTAGTYVAMPFLLSAQSPYIVTAARWYLMIVPVVALMSLAFYTLRGRSDFVPWNALRITPTLVWMGVLLLARFCGFNDVRVIAGTYLTLFSALLIPIVTVVKRRVPGGFAPDLKGFKPMLAYGLPCLASGFPIILNLRLDQMLMAALLSPAALGLYVVAVAWSGAINPLMNAIGAVLFPKVAEHGENVDRLRIFTHGSRFAALLALITAPVLAALTPFGLVLLFGQKFRSAVPAALILVPAGAVAAFNFVIEEGFRGFGENFAVLQAELAGLLITGVSLYLLLRPMGIVGASIASILGYSTVSAVLLIYAKSLTGKSPMDLLLPRSSELRSLGSQLALVTRRMAPVIARLKLRRP